MGDPGTVAAMGAPGSDPLRHDLAREVRDEVLAREPIDDDERRSIERFAAEVDHFKIRKLPESTQKIHSFHSNT